MTPSKKASPPLKQGTLFSFFAKKPEKRQDKPSLPKNSPPSKSKSSQTTKSSDEAQSPPKEQNAAPSSTKKSSVVAAAVANVKVGTKLEIYWPDDEMFYEAIVLEQRGGRYFVQYDTDGQSEWIELANERWRLVEKKNQTKRRRIVQDEDDDDEEMEFDDDADDNDDDASVFEDADEDEEDEDEEDNQWLVPDEEDEEEIVQKKKKTPKKAKPSLVVKPDPRSSRLTPKDKVRPTSSLESLTTPSPRPSFATVTPPSSSTGSMSSTEPGNPPMYTHGAVNPAGSHLHNHLEFLRNPLDSKGRPPSHPDYDPRTLKVVYTEWKKHNNGKNMTEGTKQWWDLKAQYFDTVLLFKTGKFYEMFHMDADVGVEVLGLKYMKGADAHAGFPEAAYGNYADQLVRAGYKVARVEQTETQEQFAMRKKSHNKRNGAMPKVVNREVCSILSLGTRTFCYLDECKVLEEDESSTGATQTGPLLVIKEVEYTPDENMETNNENIPRAACEYGVTMIDAIRGSVTLGQFADDVLRSRLQTLLASFSPCEIILQGGEEKASQTLESLVKTYQRTALHPCRLEVIRTTESSPRSNALDPKVRRQLERPQVQARPWELAETLDELHRCQYYPKASKQDTMDRSIARWPPVLQAVVEGEANLALSSFGAALYYLQRNLIDVELLSLGIVKAYVPPSSTIVSSDSTPTHVEQLAEVQDRAESGVADQQSNETSNNGVNMDWTPILSDKATSDDINHLALDGTTLHNLEILYNSSDGKVTGSLWSKINHAKTPHGARLLRAWLLRPLFRKADIERRAEAVEELVSGGAAVALNEARSILTKCGDIERLLSRVHSMSGVNSNGEDQGGVHPNERAVLYEQAKYTLRKVTDFSRALNGLREASQIPAVFAGLEIHSGLLSKIVKTEDQGGRFPNISAELDWFFENFDCEKAASGAFEPSRGIDSLFDEAMDTIEQIQLDLKEYQREMSSKLGGQARTAWKYINLKPESKDKYLIELPASIRVPSDFKLVGKRGSGAKQINKYRPNVVKEMVERLERAQDMLEERKSCGMKLIFAKFDAMRNLWALVANTTAMLDALGSLAITSSKPGYSRPTILECRETENPSFCITHGRHPCNDNADFVPNDISLGTEATPSSVLLLSGPNMGGKSTLLRQTCLISILAQIGCFVPAENCCLTPVDRIFTRLGASDRILLGQSTFFVELAETAAALRGATRRSLVIMDELGRGTSTFDGTAIASATVKHLVERSQCLTLFATHYHSLLDEWKEHPMVRLGHMECMVENGVVGAERERDGTSQRITFLYTLGEGVCPKSFGINVARLAGLPEPVLVKAERISSEFEEEVSSGGIRVKTAPSAGVLKQRIEKALASNDWDTLSSLWKQLNMRNS